MTLIHKRLPPIKLFSLIILASLSSIVAQAQLSVEYHGAVDGMELSFDNETDFWSYQDAQRKSYNDYGYLEYAVDSLVCEQGFCHAYIHRGERFDLDSDEAAREVQRLLRIRSQLEDTGFPFARLNINNRLDSSSLRQEVELLKGPYIILDSIVLQGESNLPSELIARQAGLKKGMPYSEKRIRAVSQALRRLSFVKLLREPELIFTQEAARVYLSLEKRNANSTEAIVGFQPDADGKVQFTGEIDLSLYNALDHLDHLRLKWQRVADNTQRLDLGLRYPYLFRTAIGLEGGLQQYRQDTTFNEVQLEAGVFAILDRGGDLGLSLISRSVNNLNETALEPQSSAGLSYKVDYSFDLLDDAVNPLKGQRSRIAFAFGEKQISNNTELNTEPQAVEQWQLTLDFDQYLQLGDRTTLKMSLNGLHTESDVILVKEQARIGGLHSLRGQDEQSIRASSYALGTVEFRLLTGERSFLHSFLDMAYLESNTIESEYSERLYGLGLGTVLDTGSGLLSLSYALGSRGGSPLDLSTGKLHLSYTALF